MPTKHAILSKLSAEDLRAYVDHYALEVEGLVVGGDARVANQHRSVSGNSLCLLLTIL